MANELSKLIHCAKWAFIASALSGAGVVVAQEDSFSRIAERAKRENQKSVTIVQTTHDDQTDAIYEGAAPELRRHSVLIATVRQRNVLTKTYPHLTIATFHAFEVEEVLRKHDDSADSSCDWETPTLQTPANQISVMWLGGTVIRDDVEIIVRYGADVQFVVGKRYVLFAALCKDGIARLPHGGRDVYEITADDRLQNSESERFPQARTLQRLRAALGAL